MTLDLRQTERIVARRLAALGRPRDLVDDDGVAALLAQAHGSEERLGAVLASTLFLASTEDAPRIGAEHVERAAASLAPEGVAWVPKTRRRRLAVWIGAGAAAAGAGLLLLRPPALAPIPSPAPRPLQTEAKHAAPALPVPKPQPQPQPAPQPPPPAPREVLLPAGPPARVQIYAALSDPAAASAAQALAGKLGSIGLAATLEDLGQAPGQGTLVGYFFTEDRDEALHVAALLGGGVAPVLLKNPSAGTTIRPPGTIQLVIHLHPETKP